MSTTEKNDYMRAAAVGGALGAVAGASAAAIPPLKKSDIDSAGESQQPDATTPEQQTVLPPEKPNVEAPQPGDDDKVDVTIDPQNPIDITAASHAISHISPTSNGGNEVIFEQPVIDGPGLEIIEDTYGGPMYPDIDPIPECVYAGPIDVDDPGFWDDDDDIWIDPALSE